MFDKPGTERPWALVSNGNLFRDDYLDFVTSNANLFYSFPQKTTLNVCPV